MLHCGSTLEGRYVIEGLLGRGATGGVYRCIDTRLHKTVAIKTRAVPADSAERSHFEREARLLATLDHPAVVAVTDYFEEGDMQFFVMQCIDGRDLQSTLDSSTDAQPVARCLDWALQICDALIYLHSQQPAVIVRDLKPSNVMLDRNHRVHLIDFGIARRCNPTASTLKGMGTDGYSPVEQYGGTTDARSDLYSLGATLYALLTRTAPPISVARLTGESVLQPPSAYNAEVSAALESVIVTLLEIHKAHRYQSAADVRRDLLAVTRPSPRVAAPIVIGVSPPSVGNHGSFDHDPLRHQSPFTIVFDGARDGAEAALASARSVGLKSRLIHTLDASSSAHWLVVVEHAVRAC